MPNITHQQYANDMILHSNEALVLKAIIKSYMDASGQKVNDGKLKIYFLNTNPKMENLICRIMGYNKGQFMCKCLGISLEKGSKSNKVWLDTLDKLDKRIGCWKDKWLSKAGKSTKISVILSTIPTLPLSCLPFSKKFLSMLEEKLWNFLWKDSNDDKKLALVRWDNLCKPKEFGGGLRIKNLQ